MAFDRVAYVEETSCHWKPRLDLKTVIPIHTEAPHHEAFWCRCGRAPSSFHFNSRSTVGPSSTPSDLPPRKAPPVGWVPELVLSWRCKEKFCPRWRWVRLVLSLCSSILTEILRLRCNKCNYAKALISVLPGKSLKIKYRVAQKNVYTFYS